MRKATKTPNLSPILKENSHLRARERGKIFYRDKWPHYKLNINPGFIKQVHPWQPLINFRQGEYIREYRRYLTDNQDFMVAYQSRPLCGLIGLDKRLTFPNANLNAQNND